MTNAHQPVQLHSTSTGSSNHPDLIILHGLFGDLNNWKAIANRLAAHFQVHCMDLRNHGNSPHTSGMSYPEMAFDVAHTCKALGISNTFVIGHSMGGKTAMQLALDNAELVDKLAVVDIGPRRYGRHHSQIIDGLQFLSGSAIESRKQADDILQPYVEDAGIRAFLLKNLKRSDNNQYKLRVNIDEIASRYDDIADHITSENTYTKHVLFLKGVESDYLTDADREPIAKLFSSPSLKAIDGAGHWPHSEKPDVVYKILFDFFAAGASTSSA